MDPQNELYDLLGRSLNGRQGIKPQAFKKGVGRCQSSWVTDFQGLDQHRCRSAMKSEYSVNSAAALILSTSLAGMKEMSMQRQRGQ
jgi:hypothetical protein